MKGQARDGARPPEMPAGQNDDRREWKEREIFEQRSKAIPFPFLPISNPRKRLVVNTILSPRWR
jgi:hypothetical protein